MTATALAILHPALPGSDLSPWSAAAQSFYLPLLSMALATGDMERVTEICTSPDIPDPISRLSALTGATYTDPSDKRN